MYNFLNLLIDVSAMLQDCHKVQQVVDIYMFDCLLIFLFLAFVLKHSNIFPKIIWWYLIASKNGQNERLEITGIACNFSPNLAKLRC
jgi:hypothetical protein